jgi:hypothetical protein
MEVSGQLHAPAALPPGDISDIYIYYCIYFEVKVKVNVKLSLCLTKHHTMKAYWGVEL